MQLNPLPLKEWVAEAKAARNSTEFVEIFETRIHRGPDSLEDLINCLRELSGSEYEIPKADSYQYLKLIQGPAHRNLPPERPFEISVWGRDARDTALFPRKFYIRNPAHRVLVYIILDRQRLIPGLRYSDIAPIARLEIETLQPYRDLQIIRGLIPPPIDIKDATKDARLAAAQRISKLIPLNLANPEANGALSRMIKRRYPYGKAGFRKLLLPSLVFESIGDESTLQDWRKGSKWIKTLENAKAQAQPLAYPLSEYWKWLKNRTQSALERWVLLENEGNPDGFKMIEASTYDEANPTISCDGGFDSIEISDSDYVPDSIFDCDIDNRIYDLAPAAEDLGAEIGIDAIVAMDAIQKNAGKRGKSYLAALSRIIRGNPEISSSEAHRMAREELGITDNNGRQILLRIKRAASIAQRTIDLERASQGGHPLLRPDGTEIRVPAWVIGALDKIRLLLPAEEGRPRRLNPAIYAILGNTEKVVVVGGADGDHALFGDPDGVFLSPKMSRLAMVLGRDLSGPGERLTCNCPKCRL